MMQKRHEIQLWPLTTVESVVGGGRDVHGRPRRRPRATRARSSPRSPLDGVAHPHQRWRGCRRAPVGRRTTTSSRGGRGRGAATGASRGRRPSTAGSRLRLTCRSVEREEAVGASTSHADHGEKREVEGRRCSPRPRRRRPRRCRCARRVGQLCRGADEAVCLPNWREGGGRRRDGGCTLADWRPGHRRREGVRGGNGVEAGGGHLSGSSLATARRGSPPVVTRRASSSPPPTAAPAHTARHGTRRRGAGVSSLSCGGPLRLRSPAATRASSTSLRSLLPPPPCAPPPADLPPWSERAEPAAGQKQRGPRVQRPCSAAEAAACERVFFSMRGNLGGPCGYAECSRKKFGVLWLKRS
jgi:hypothetical protein